MMTKCCIGEFLIPKRLTCDQMDPKLEEFVAKRPQHCTNYVPQVMAIHKSSMELSSK